VKLADTLRGNNANAVPPASSMSLKKKNVNYVVRNHPIVYLACDKERDTK